MVNIIGMGYIGLPTALMMAANGVEIVGTDINAELITELQEGHVTFKETGLLELFNKAREKNIVFTNEYQKADIYIISVPTPYDKLNKKIDPSYVVEAIKSILKYIQHGSTIIIESTISPGTIDKFIRPIITDAGYSIGKDVHLAHAPERIIPGNMIYELEHNSRTIGVDSDDIGRRIKALYASFCKGNIVITDIKTAEMTKVIENTYRDINIAFANELARICDINGMNVYEIIRIANMHPRVNILQPGPGVGGHCISVDPWFLVGDYPLDANLIHLARTINESMPGYVLEKTYKIMKDKKINDPGRVGFYGLTYKENVDDVRESPTLQLYENMKKYLSNGARFYDPMVTKHIVENQYMDFDKFIHDIDLVVIMVKHQHLLDNADKLRDKVVFDTRNVTDLNAEYKL